MSSVAPQYLSHNDLRMVVRRLRENIAGEVRFDDGSRALYATDASLCRIFESDVPVVVQHTRLDMRLGKLSLLSTLAYGAES